MEPDGGQSERDADGSVDGDAEFYGTERGVGGDADVHADGDGGRRQCDRHGGRDGFGWPGLHTPFVDGGRGAGPDGE